MRCSHSHFVVCIIHQTSSLHLINFTSVLSEILVTFTCTSQLCSAERTDATLRTHCDEGFNLHTAGRRTATISSPHTYFISFTSIPLYDITGSKVFCAVTVVFSWINLLNWLCSWDKNLYRIKTKNYLENRMGEKYDFFFKKYCIMSGLCNIQINVISKRFIVNNISFSPQNRCCQSLQYKS